jgi:hypothetical protein
MFFADPEEMARAQAHNNVMRHEIKALFDSLDEDQSATLVNIFENLLGEDAGRIAAHMAGRLSEIREKKFGICSACGVNHNEELKQMTDPSSEFEPTPAYTPIGSAEPMQAWEQAEMDEYNLDDLRDEDTKRLIGFVCKGCGTQRTTIQDRKLKPPGVEGCGGCQQKAKWG